MEGHLLLVILALPFIAGLASFLLPTNSRAPATWLAGTTTLACFAFTVLLYASIRNGQSLRYQIEWLPSLGLDFTLRMDGFAWVFASLVSGIGFLVVLYTR